MYKRIIVIVGMPRSGTSWLSQIIDSSPQVKFKLSPIFSYQFKNAVNERSSKADYEKMFTQAYHSNNMFMDQTERRKIGQYPTFNKKDIAPEILAIKMTRFHNLIHKMLELFDNLKVIAIVRHPCGAIHSWLTNPGEFPTDKNPLLEWRTGNCRKTGFGEFWGFDDWKKVTKLHLKLAQKFPSKFEIIRYESIVENKVLETKKIFQFLDMEYTNQTDNFLIQSHQKHDGNPYAVFKSTLVKDRWKKELQPIIRETICNEIADTDLAKLVL